MISGFVKIDGNQYRPAILDRDVLFLFTEEGSMITVSIHDVDSVLEWVKFWHRDSDNFADTLTHLQREAESVYDTYNVPKNNAVGGAFSLLDVDEDRPIGVDQSKIKMKPKYDREKKPIKDIKI